MGSEFFLGPSLGSILNLPALALLRSILFDLGLGPYLEYPGGSKVMITLLRLRWEHKISDPWILSKTYPALVVVEGIKFAHQLCQKKKTPNEENELRLETEKRTSLSQWFEPNIGSQ